MFQYKQKTFSTVKPYHLFAMAILSSTIVQSKVAADEMVYYDTATNLQQVKEEPGNELTPESPESSIPMSSQLDESKLNQAVEEARANGLNVFELPAKDLGTFTNQNSYEETIQMVQNDYQYQKNQLVEATKSYQDEFQAYELEKQRVEEENQALKSSYQEDLTRITATNTIRKKEFEDSLNTVSEKNAQIIKDNQLIEAENKKNYEAYVISLNKAKQSVEQSKQNVGVEDIIEETKTSYTPSLHWRNLTSQTLNSNITVVAEGNVQSKENLTDGTYTITAFSNNGNSLPASSIISSVRWTSEIPFGETLIQKDKISEEIMEKTGDGKVYDTSTGGTTQEWSVKVGQWVTFPKIVTLADGSKRDLRAKFEKTGSKMDFGEDWILLWNANGAINYLDGSSLVGHYPDDGIKVTYEIIDEDEPNKEFLWILAALDIDGGQALTLHGPKDTALLSVGGGLRVNSKVSVEADEDLGYTYGNGHNKNALDGVNSTPDGVVIYASYGRKIEHELRNSLGGRGSLVADADFGLAINTNVIANYEPKKMKKVLDLPKVDYLPLPAEPSYKTLPEFPQIPTLNFQKYRLSYQPIISKSVHNSDGLNINQEHIAKGSELFWSLDLPKVPKFTDKVRGLTLNDKLPTGFRLNLEKTIQINPDYEIHYQQESYDLVARAKESLIKQINSGEKIPSVKLVGNVLNDAAVYKNRYLAEFKLSNGKNHSLSNVVTVVTAGRQQNKYFNNDSKIEPLKHIYNSSNEIADNKTFIGGEVTNYELIWDLDQYRGDQSSHSAIDKGFALIDDIPEDVLDIIEKDIQIKDSSGQSVDDLALSFYTSLNEMSKEDQVMLQNAQINLKGSFIIWKPKNNQEFYKKYVKQGKSIHITLPVLLDSVNELKSFENQAFQIDFGNGYQSKIVQNLVQPLQSLKKVVNSHFQELEGQNVINLNDHFYYFLEGAEIQANQANPIKNYKFIDDYDEYHDKYLNHYQLILDTDIILKDGKKILRGADITNYSKSTHHNGILSIEVDPDLLSQLSSDSGFKAKVMIEMKRFRTGLVKNHFTNVINDKEVLSNEVKTHTPDTPSKSNNSPKRIEKKINESNFENEKVLPNTGDSQDRCWLGYLLMPMLFPIILLKKWSQNGRSL